MTEKKSIAEYNDIELEITVDPETNDVCVKFSQFDNHIDAEEYAEYLFNLLPLMLFESNSVH
jgi:hypothetical protein